MASRKKPAAPTIRRVATGKGYYVYRDATGKFASREAWEVSRQQRKKVAKPKERLLKEMRPRVRKSVVLPEAVKRPGRKVKPINIEKVKKQHAADHALPTDAFELSVSYRGRGRGAGVNIKIRVEVKHAMRSETVRLLVDRAMRDGIVPPGIAIHGIDWTKEGAKRLQDYAYSGDVVPDAMRAAYNIIMSPGARRRFDPVAPDSEGWG